MEVHTILENLCRVCAANNTKGKNSMPECVYVLKTPGLKDKIEKYLYLKIDENDILPKVLCKTCFRQVEATAALSNIANHTQKVFKDYLLSTLPKTAVSNNTPPADASTGIDPNNALEFTSLELNLNKAESRFHYNKTLPPAPAPSKVVVRTQNKRNSSTPPASSINKEDVVVNVSVNDPLTRDNQQKLISNSQRRHSMLLDTRYTPKSIAQKSFNAIPQYQKETNTNDSNKKQSPPGVINFFPTSTDAMPIKSNSAYVPGTRLNSGSDRQDSKNTEIASAKHATDLTTNAEIIQQKRKNLSRTLNNIKSCTGQISLLKVSHQKSQINNNNETVNPTIAESLPEKIIIAAPKVKTARSRRSSNKYSKNSSLPPAPPILPPPHALDFPITHQQSLPKPVFPEDMLLGRVIRDVDLLKLILKALKWPVDHQSIEMQIQRLRNSKFTEIMSDPNLLQDTDLTQLLGPYLAPVFLAAQALQQQQHQNLLKAAQAQTFAFPPPTTKPVEVSAADLNSSIPYKLPPETSVQLVPACPDEGKEVNNSQCSTSSSSNLSLKRDRISLLEPKPNSFPTKRVKKSPAEKDKHSLAVSSIENTDKDERLEEKQKAMASLKHRSSPTKSTAHLNGDPKSSFINQFSLLSDGVDASTEALMALLQRQKAALSRQQRAQRRRHSSHSNILTLPVGEFDALIDIGDDIVLMEPVNTISTSTTSTDSQITVPDKPLEQQPDKVTFALPGSINLTPVITRPIIKRRKTVIQTVPRSKSDLTTENDKKSQDAINNKKKILVDEEATQTSSHVINVDTQMSKTQREEVQCLSKSTSTEAILSQASTASTVTSLLSSQDNNRSKNKKNQSSKASLGQQLLEAIGLQKVTGKPNPSYTTSDISTTSTATKESIEQIRSALKRSLKQAQEQQEQLKNEGSGNDNTDVTGTAIKQDADSTTRPLIKEVIVEGKPHTDNSLVDLEEQIDKVTLMVRKSMDKNRSLTATKSNEKKSVGRGRPPHPTNLAIKSDKALLAIEDAADKKMDNEKSEERNLSVNSSTRTAVPASLGDSLTATEVLRPKEEVPATPKRRGRKKNIDKELEANTAPAASSEKEVEKTIKTEILDKPNQNETSLSQKTDDQIPTATGRPTRHSKTLSKYYKGPEKVEPNRRALPSRATRNRQYSKS
uniref:ZAD domain-containing protein n=1 Tax=Glossina brevipalpis TaxID=37001 RepID=A0A1A9W0J0_9MUSC